MSPQIAQTSSALACGKEAPAASLRRSSHSHGPRDTRQQSILRLVFCNGKPLLMSSIRSSRLDATEGAGLSGEPRVDDAREELLPLSLGGGDKGVAGGSGDAGGEVSKTFSGLLSCFDSESGSTDVPTVARGPCTSREGWTDGGTGATTGLWGATCGTVGTCAEGGDATCSGTATTAGGACAGGTSLGVKMAAGGFGVGAGRWGVTAGAEGGGRCGGACGRL